MSTDHSPEASIPAAATGEMGQAGPPAAEDARVVPVAIRNVTLVFERQRSLVVGAVLLVALLICGGIIVPGLFSVLSLRSMLLSASFLGIAALGQTLCALIGGIDLSIPFVIGSANILMLWLTSIQGVPSGIAFLLVMIFGVMVGALNGLACLRLQGQSLVVTLGSGTALLALIEIVTTNSAQSGGTIIATVPRWLVEMSSLDGGGSGLPVAPTIVVWVVIAAAAILLLSRSWLGRAIYAQGGNRVAAKRALVSERTIWVTTFAVSGLMAALVGMFLLGFSGGAFSDVGQPYLFTTVSAVVVGGTALVGGRGGYGQTVLGVCIITVLTVVLVGLNLSPAAQEMVLGILLIPLVAAYARLPHPRMRV